MADVYSRETRSRVMSRVRGKDTGPELALRRELWALGVRGWRCHRRDLPGRPDLSFGRVKVAIFVDGAWWHGHPKYFKPGKSGEYWDKKIERNKERDRSNGAALATLGWRVLRLWDFEILADPSEAARRVMAALDG